MIGTTLESPKVSGTFSTGAILVTFLNSGYVVFGGFSLTWAVTNTADISESSSILGT